MTTAKELYGYMLREDAHISIEEVMIQFARLHVTQALKQASENATAKCDPDDYTPYINSDSILNAYPLDNIK